MEVDFDVNCADPQKMLVVDAALHRFGCRTEAIGHRLHVWMPLNQAPKLLSGRELQLACLASKGHTDKEIAGMVGLSIYTIRSYWVRICHKLGAHNRTHAVSILFGSDLVFENAAEDFPFSDDEPNAPKAC